MSLALALLLSSHTVLQHNVVDMGAHYGARWDVNVELRVDGAGAATFHVVGTVRDNRVDDAWTGRATVSPSAVVVHFDHYAQHGHAHAVDVGWRCDLASTPVSNTATPVWRCATTSNPNGNSPAYMQVPTHLAAPAIGLRVEATARGESVQRSTMTNVTLSR